MWLRSIAAAFMLFPSTAAFGDGGFLRFARDTDTVRIFGNTEFPSVDFTYEMRIRVAPNSAMGHVISEQRDTYEDKHVRMSPSQFVGYMTRGQACGNANESGWESLAGTWQHVAYVRSSGTAYLFVNGQLEASWTQQANCTGNSPDSAMSLGMIRYTYACPQLPSFRGDLDWIRISRVARYTEAFQPPSECDLQSDADTILLLRCNEGPGQVLLDDEGPNDYRCELGAIACGGPATSPSLHVGSAEACGCPGDVTGGGEVNAIDLAAVLGAWGTDGQGKFDCDTNADGIVDALDLAQVLSDWGPCPE